MNPLLSFIEQAMGLGASGGEALLKALKGDQTTPMAQATNEDWGGERNRATNTPPVPMQRPARPMGTPDAQVPTLRSEPAPPIAAAMAPQPSSPEQPSAMALAMDPNATRMGPQQGAQPVQGLQGYEQGTLGKVGDYLNKAFGVTDPDFLYRLSNGLAVAGSKDPFKALTALRQQQAEEGKMAAERKKAMMPKRDQIAGTPIAQIIDPTTGKLLGEEVSPVLAQFYKTQGDNRTAAAIEKAVVEDRLARNRDQEKADTKSASEASPLLRQAQEQLASIEIARETLPRMGMLDQAKGLFGPVGSTAASFTKPQMNIDSQRRSAVRVLDWVRLSEPLKGALSNVEGLKLDMPLPQADAAPEEWAAYFDNSERVLKAAEAHLQKKVDSGSSGAAPAAAPQAAPQAAPRANAGGAARPPMAVPGISQRTFELYGNR